MAVNWEKLITILKETKIDWKNRRWIKELCTRQKAAVHINENIKINKLDRLEYRSETMSIINLSEFYNEDTVVGEKRRGRKMQKMVGDIMRGEYKKQWNKHGAVTVGGI